MSAPKAGKGWHGAYYRGAARDRLKAKRAAAQGRRRRANGAPPVPVTAQLLVTCLWPWKHAHPDRKSAAARLRIKQQEEGGRWMTAEVYRCPVADHFHVGHVPEPPQRRKGDRRQEREEAA